MKVRVLAVVALTLAAACAKTAPCPPEAPRTTAKATGAPAGLAARVALFWGLAELVKRHHVASEDVDRALGRRFDDELRTLEPEFARAETKDALIAALVRFGNALHNPHCGFRPASSPPELVVGVTLDVEWRDGGPLFYVVRSVGNTGVLAGDEIASIDGVAAARLLDAHALSTNRNNRFAMARRLARFLSRRPALALHEGDVSRWTVRRAGAALDVELRWRAAPDDDDGTGEIRVDYDKPVCGVHGMPDYGPSYALRGEGSNFCFYTSSTPALRDYPVVRFFSFNYGEGPLANVQHRVRADHARLAQLLAASPARGVLLDLRENSGGHDPNWFLDWFAPAPYTDHYVLTRLDDAARDPAFLKRVDIDEPNVPRYLAELERRSPGQAFAPPRPFYCESKERGGCGWDNRYAPAHSVVGPAARVALLVGPDCLSSCDAFTQIFDEHEFGPLVGEPTGTGHTTERLRHTVELAGEKLGELRLAFSYEVSGKSKQRLEGVPIHLDRFVPRTARERERHGERLIAAAIELLQR